MGSHATGEKARYRDFLDPLFRLGLCVSSSSPPLSLSLCLSPFSFNYTAKVMIDTRLIELAQQPRSISCPSFSLLSMSARSWCPYTLNNNEPLHRSGCTDACTWACYRCAGFMGLTGCFTAQGTPVYSELNLCLYNCGIVFGAMLRSMTCCTIRSIEPPYRHLWNNTPIPLDFLPVFFTKKYAAISLPGLSKVFESGGRCRERIGRLVLKIGVLKIGVDRFVTSNFSISLTWE